MSNQETPFERECAWTGNTGPGKHYILTSTEGTELVSADALPHDLVQQLDHLSAAVNRLSKRVAQLEGRGAGGAEVPQQKRGARKEV